jgi:dihydrofolate reductase
MIYAASSLDSYLAPADGSVSWLEAFGTDEAADLGYDAFLAGIGSLVIGRTTYEQVLGFGEWPYHGKPTTVLTTRESLGDDPPPPGVRTDHGDDLAQLVRALQDEAEGATWLVGGGTVHRAFLAAGLVDEIWTHVMPVLLGSGVAMFPPAFPRQSLTLLESRTYHGGGPGIVLLRYRVD